MYSSSAPSYPISRALRSECFSIVSKNSLPPVTSNIEKKKLADTTPAYTTYTVKRGDTLGAIARRYRTTTAQIMKLNKLKNANKLREGQRLRIPIRR